ncbi:MAG: hypothetical protein HYT22_01365 [Candidatus Niyogibacteria bacterium]|nr:hypothetical protein [Candidatus Niyogibacteria bacterium]
MEKNWQAEILACFAGISDYDYADWGGSGALLELYDSSGGEDRTIFIRAIGEIIETNDNPRVVGSLVQFVTALDLVQLDETMRNLTTSGKFVNEPEILKAITNYFAMRKLRSLPKTSS